MKTSLFPSKFAVREDEIGEPLEVGEVILLEGKPHEVISHSFKLWWVESTDKAIAEYSRKIKNDINSVLGSYGYECYKIDYELPECKNDPVEVTAYILNYEEYTGKPLNFLNEIDRKLQGMNYFVQFD